MRGGAQRSRRNRVGPVKSNETQDLIEIDLLFKDRQFSTRVNRLLLRSILLSIPLPSSPTCIREKWRNVIKGGTNLIIEQGSIEQGCGNRLIASARGFESRRRPFQVCLSDDEELKILNSHSTCFIVKFCSSGKRNVSFLEKNIHFSYGLLSTRFRHL